MSSQISDIGSDMLYMIQSQDTISSEPEQPGNESAASALSPESASRGRKRGTGRKQGYFPNLL